MGVVAVCLMRRFSSAVAHSTTMATTAFGFRYLHGRKVEKLGKVFKPKQLLCECILMKKPHACVQGGCLSRAARLWQVPSLARCCGDSPDDAQNGERYTGVVALCRNTQTVTSHHQPLQQHHGMLRVHPVSGCTGRGRTHCATGTPLQILTRKNAMFSSRRAPSMSMLSGTLYASASCPSCAKRSQSRGGAQSASGRSSQTCGPPYLQHPPKLCVLGRLLRPVHTLSLGAALRPCRIQ